MPRGNSFHEMNFAALWKAIC